MNLEEKDARSSRKIMGLVFGYMGSFEAFLASINFYFMPSWVYYPLILPISIPSLLIFFISTTLIFKAPQPAGCFLLIGSLATATVTLLVPFRIQGLGLELLIAALLAGIGGTAALLTGRTK